jgi:hypothetical protein
VLRKPVFWVMYAMFVMVAAGGLMATAQLAPIAKDFKIDDVPVNIMGLVLPALTFALAIDRVLNGLTRPFFGWVSDQIGREQTMFIASRSKRSASSRCTVRPEPGGLRDPHRPGVLRLGRDLQPVPLDLRGHLRLRSTPPPTPACCTPPRARPRCWCRCPACSRRHRQLARGVHRRQRDERDRGGLAWFALRPMRARPPGASAREA